MDSAFASIAFAEPARTQTNLELIRQRLPGALWPRLPTLLAQVPDPDAALNYLERFLRETPPAILSLIAETPAALHSLLVVFTYSRFLSETLIQQPELIAWLHPLSRALSGRRGKKLHRADDRDALGRARSRETLSEELDSFERGSRGQPAAVVLPQFKRREYLRIMLRDLLGLATLAETCHELSQLADVLLERALTICEHKLLEAYGAPQITDAAGRRRTARLTIISLGKLGGTELNYSSDLDLMFLYTGEGETAGGAAGTVTNAEHFIRLSQAVLKLVTEPTAHGALFRVDMRLRPQGSEGDLAMGLPAALDYYRTRAREWELQMLIKARASAGDPANARHLLAELQPLIYRPVFNIAAVAAVLNAREEITRELHRRPGRTPGHAAAWNVKLSPGGIRDIEFLVQCLARVYGGADPWLRCPSTLLALQRLHDKGHLSGHDFDCLASAYQFLRVVEHRLQLRDGLQRHTLPDDPAALDRLARRCGVDAGRASDGSAPHAAGDFLCQRITRHFAEVREIYQRHLAFPEGSPAPPADDQPPEHTVALLPAELQRQYPRLARAAEAVPSDPWTRRGMQNFLSTAALDPAMLRELEAHPGWLIRAGELFSLSDLAAETLARHPEEIRVLADPGLVGLRGPLVEEAEDASSLESAMVHVRRAYRRSVFATVVRALTGLATPFATFSEFTRLADEALRGALNLAARDFLGPTGWSASPLAVIALGRLGTQEMDIGSDADLVFVCDESLSAEEREPWRRVAERLVHVVGSHTRDGILFPVDTRLRPRGTEGEMMQTVAYLHDYLRNEAPGWEAVSWLKARALGGNLSLAARAIAQGHDVLQQRWAADGGRALAGELAELRLRLEREGTGPRSRTEFKHLAGGFFDIEYVLGLSLFRSFPSSAGSSLPQPLGSTLDQISFAEAVGALSQAHAVALRQSARLFRSVDHAHRLITGRPANHPPEQTLAGRIARLLANWRISLSPPGPAGLETALEEARRETRCVYDEVVVAATVPSS